jgi:hypothetical protein
MAATFAILPIASGLQQKPVQCVSRGMDENGGDAVQNRQRACGPAADVTGAIRTYFRRIATALGEC